ncbi:hypothetical protein CMI47_06935 [Candidatus Pacearchaeota archaeon]|nr:hypothetical protein [Candidatus Pacearchaeota archaeon]|tara:strand:- start:265 stop:528 length:264 start_codon:yes stop_codon:yes gene_type:complete
MSTIKKLTPALLKSLVLDEKRKLAESGLPGAAADDTKEVDADSLASTLSNKIDHAKKLGLAEARLTKNLKRVRRIRDAIKSQILKEL